MRTECKLGYITIKPLPTLSTGQRCYSVRFEGFTIRKAGVDAIKSLAGTINHIDTIVEPKSKNLRGKSMQLIIDAGIRLNNNRVSETLRMFLFLLIEDMCEHSKTQARQRYALAKPS